MSLCDGGQEALSALQELCDRCCERFRLELGDLGDRDGVEAREGLEEGFDREDVLEQGPQHLDALRRGATEGERVDVAADRGFLSGPGICWLGCLCDSHSDRLQLLPLCHTHVALPLQIAVAAVSPAVPAAFIAVLAVAAVIILLLLIAGVLGEAAVLLLLLLAAVLFSTHFALPDLVAVVPPANIVPFAVVLAGAAFLRLLLLLLLLTPRLAPVTDVVVQLTCHGVVLTITNAGHLVWFGLYVLCIAHILVPKEAHLSTF